MSALDIDLLRVSAVGLASGEWMEVANFEVHEAVEFGPGDEAHQHLSETWVAFDERRAMLAADEGDPLQRPPREVVELIPHAAPLSAVFAIRLMGGETNAD